MIVAYDAKRVFHNFTGLGNYCRSTLNMLAEYHPEVEQQLFTPSLGHDDTRTADFRERAVLPTGLWHTGLLPSGSPSISLLPKSLWRTFFMGRQASRQADVFHGLSHELPFGLDIPSIVTMHDVAFRTFPDMYKPIDRQIYDAKWRYACNHATHIIAISQSTRNDVQRFYDVPDACISVVCQPVDSSYYYENVMSRPRLDGLPNDYALYVGSINSRKNLLGIVQAIEAIPTERRLPLVVVGNGHEYKTRVQRYIHTHKLEQWVLFLGTVAGTNSLQSLYRHARMFIYPSHYEGMGLPVIEAQLCGCPVITSNVSSLPEAGGEAAIQVPPTDISALSAAIDRLTTDDTLATDMSRKGRSRCLRLFHPAVLADSLAGIYRDCSK